MQDQTLEPTGLAKWGTTGRLTGTGPGFPSSESAGGVDWLFLIQTGAIGSVPIRIEAG
jgi:hypothetical protein